jgi:hypothetical protein
MTNGNCSPFSRPEAPLKTPQKPRLAKVRNKLTLHAFGSALYLATVLALGMWAFLQMIDRPGVPNWGSFTILLLMACAATPLKIQLPGVDRSLSTCWWGARKTIRPGRSCSISLRRLSVFWLPRESIRI